MLTLTQRDGKWVVLRDGHVLSVKDNHEDAIAAMLAVEEEAPSAAALLPETWEGPIARSKLTGDGRDFTACKWTWRDPEVSRLPLMWQTETDMGHFSAQLAGYITSLELRDGTVWATGVFFDNEQGREFRDVLATAGRWGVSVDPGAVEWEDTCLEEDDEGWCVEGLTTFLAYEVIGVTGTPFPAFEDAWIELAGTSTSTDAEAARLSIDNMPEHAFDDTDDDGLCDFEAESGEVCDGTAQEHVGRWDDDEDDTSGDESDPDEQAAVAASGAPVRPPAAWFEDPKLTEPTPCTITDEGRVYGHIATFDQCHIGWQNVCITAPEHVAASHFHTGNVLTAEGTMIATGPLVMDTDHPALDLDWKAALDHYAHTGCAWADVRVGVDEIGIWCAGALRPGITEEQVRVLRGSSLSGDWRPIDGKAALVAAIAVNTPGFPIPRALAASGRPVPQEAKPMRARLVAGNVLAATGVGMVRCGECAKRAQAAVVQSGSGDQRLDQVLSLLHVIETRTRALAQTRREQLRARLRRER